MFFSSKQIDLIGSRARRTGLALGVLLGLLSSPPAGAGQATPFEWQDGLIEANSYTFEEGGLKTGEIEQRVYGVLDRRGRQRFKAVYELIRGAGGSDAKLQGRATTEIIFDAETLELAEKLENFAIADTVGKIRVSRTPQGFKSVMESFAQGAPREPEEREVSYPTSEPLIDEAVLVYLVRALADQDGRSFEAMTINPLHEGMSRTKGKVGAVQEITWNGKSVKVRRVDCASPTGTMTYFTRVDGLRTVVRYISSNGEVYNLKAAAAPAHEPVP